MTSSTSAWMRSARTAPPIRCGSSAPNLAREFEGVRSEAAIRACADAILAEFVDAPVRSFVMTLANTKARECLRAEQCFALTHA